jgi:methyltransferase (TIGR00027 family)
MELIHWSHPIKPSRDPKLSAWLGIGLLFLPAIPAYLFAWPNLEGECLDLFQVLTYFYILAGTVYIGRRRFSWDQLGLNRRGIGLALLCGVVLLAARGMIIASIQWNLPRPRLTWLKIIGDLGFYIGLVGLVEELLFRGLIYRLLEEWRGVRWAIWGSSFGFVLWHVFGQGLLVGFASLLIGLLFAMIRWRGGGILGLIFLHGLWDLETAWLVADSNAVILDFEKITFTSQALTCAGSALLILVPVILYFGFQHPRSAASIHGSEKLLAQGGRRKKPTEVVPTAANIVSNSIDPIRSSQEKKEKDKLMENRAARTIYGPMVTVACEQAYPENQRLVRDGLAYHFLPGGVKLMVKMFSLPPVRKLLFSVLDKKSPGVWGGVLCRKRYIDDHLAEALQSGLEAVVILGAGLDTHAYRGGAIDRLLVYEVDLPVNTAYKRAKVQQLFGGVPENVSLVGLDLNEVDLGLALAEHGCPLSQKCFFICEAVTQYLTAAGVDNIFRSLAQARGGSQGVFTYIYQDFLDGTNRYGLDLLYRAYCQSRVWQFGLNPGQVGAFLQSYGWLERQQIGGREFEEKLVKPIGRDLSVMEVERSVLAEKT